jgi:hypothetical protein
MPLHVLFSPLHNDFVREGHLPKDKNDPRYGSDKPITTELKSPTRGDAPPGSPHGTHWMQLEDTIYDVGQGSFVGPNNKLGEPVIELLTSGRAVRKFPILRK